MSDLASTEERAPVARVVAEHKNNCVIRANDTDLIATVRGSFHAAGTYPKVGDYVEYSETTQGQAVIERILPRKSQIVRDATERRSKSAVQKEQIIVTNVDVIFIVMGLDGDFSPRRLERYLLLAHQSGIVPVVVLNKADVVSDGAQAAERAAGVAGKHPVHLVSARTGAGMSALDAYIQPETTVVLLGSSGAGKSTITNWLLGRSAQSTGPVRDDDSRGKHTTTSRELFALPRGGFLIDTPGMRELGTVEAVTEEAEVFGEIIALTQQCRYPDCDHEKSEGCAVLAALESGQIDEHQVRAYLKLQREQEHKRLKTDHSAYMEHKQSVKRRHKEYNKILKQKNRSGDITADEVEEGD